MQNVDWKHVAKNNNLNLWCDPVSHLWCICDPGVEPQDADAYVIGVTERNRKWFFNLWEELCATHS